ncbi:autotransporter domain-containing protein [Allosphingosinicella indica]|uniref:Phospholipase/lecithinase/hemolysin n=1 Tax=Allosphingosinicella indica TaxID=941907 RepID=A0A1X7G0G8_9SPHN|nr:autotransporter domain-containing protein [Allosphingosinicella indica]SMF61860.1 Phospholipase/lecithinase/hemolysin [Allosphingosinicella indica]
MPSFSARLLAAVASSAFLAGTPAAAQSVDRIVAFGDSYADDGNLFELLGIPRPQVYPTGRFSGGTNFVDTMGQLLTVPIDNFAIGGAFTGPGNTGFTNINGPGIPGFPTEVGAYLAGGGPAAFPRVSGTFDASDLVVVSIGGNDARYYQFNGGTVAGAPAAAAISVGEATAGLRSLVGAGAQNITFLAGDVGRLPEVRGTPIAAVGTAFATSFNNGIKTQLGNLAAGGVIVNYLDLNLIGDRVEANLGAYGLTSAGACPVECVTNPNLQSQYLFYVDQVHLTSAGFAIVGRYAVRQLQAPLQFQAQSDLGIQTAQAFGSTLIGRLDLSPARRGGEAQDGLSAYLLGSFAGRDTRTTAASYAYDIDVPAVTGGFEYGMGNGATVGAALNYSRPKADFDTINARARADAWQVGVYAGWAGPAAFVQGYAGLGWLDLKTRREAVIDDIAGKTDGDTVTAGAKAGYLMGLGGLRAGPVIGLQYARAKLDAYTEAGDPVLTNNIGAQRLETLVGSLGAEVRGEWDAGGLAVQPYLSLTAERDFEGDSRTIRYAATATPGIVNSFVLPDRPKDTYGRVMGGADFSLGGGFALQVNGGTSFSRRGGDDFSGFVGLKAAF